MKYIKIIYLLSFILLFGAGCSIFGGKTVNTNDGGIFQSGDFGNTWQAINYVGQDGKNQITINNVNTKQLFFHPQDKSTIYLLSQTQGLYKTDNAGGQWQLLNQNLGPIGSFAQDAKEPETLYASRGGNILKTVDEGLNWETIYIESRAGQSISYILVDFFDNQKVYAGTNTGVLLYSVNGGETWSIKSTPNIAMNIMMFHPDDSRMMYIISYGGGIWQSKDSGVTWSVITEQLYSTNKTAYQINDFTIDPNNPEKMMVASNYGLFITADAGKNWELLESTILPGTVPILTANFDPNKKPIIYFTVGNKMHRSTDNGRNWSIVEIPTTRNITEMIINPEDSTIIYTGLTQPIK
ncbi:YCF48-related protein [Patescibacteria group bacterium]